MNNEKLVREMWRLEAEQGTVSTERKYVSVAVCVDGGFERAEGEVVGEVLDSPRGALGFGYDPYFLAPELGGTFAESSIENTARHSHRGKER